ncbi:unnamed protein product, partial [Symbiodinium necroappetens]
IFEKFDTDKDGILNLKAWSQEFNELQVSTEGGEAMYNSDQLKQLLIAVNPDVKAPEKGMPFSDYRRLYLEGGLRRVTSPCLCAAGLCILAASCGLHYRAVHDFCSHFGCLQHI